MLVQSYPRGVCSSLHSPRTPSGDALQSIGCIAIRNAGNIKVIAVSTQSRHSCRAVQVPPIPYPRSSNSSNDHAFSSAAAASIRTPYSQQRCRIALKAADRQTVSRLRRAYPGPRSPTPRPHPFLEDFIRNHRGGVSAPQQFSSQANFRRRRKQILQPDLWLPHLEPRPTLQNRDRAREQALGQHACFVRSRSRFNPPSPAMSKSAIPKRNPTRRRRRGLTCVKRHIEILVAPGGQ